MPILPTEDNLLDIHEGWVQVTMKLQRSDGQYVTSITRVPADLLAEVTNKASRAHQLVRQKAAENRIARGFAETYHRLMELSP